MDEISKTKRKKAMLALQDLGEELIALNREQLDRLALPEMLYEAVLDAQHMQKFGARKRQSQFIGRLMRGTDAEAIREKLETIRGSSRAHAAWLHRIERLREGVLKDDSALAQLAENHPEADLAGLPALIEGARADDKRSYRELFRELRKLFPEE